MSLYIRPFCHRFRGGKCFFQRKPALPPASAPSFPVSFSPPAPCCGAVDPSLHRRAKNAFLTLPKTCAAFDPPNPRPRSLFRANHCLGAAATEQQWHVPENLRCDSVGVDPILSQQHYVDFSATSGAGTAGITAAVSDFLFSQEEDLALVYSVLQS